jgi:hypothetical protein
MSELVADCPRCRSSRMTFDLKAAVPVGEQYGWQVWYEAFCVCRHCGRATIFVISEKGIEESRVVRTGLLNVGVAVNKLVNIEHFISIKDVNAVPPPEHVPKEVAAIFSEGATCLTVRCFNAAGTMFRLCVDLATKPLLPKDDRDGLNSKIRRDLGLRLPWLFNHGLLPAGLQELSSCIKDAGNDGAHAGSLEREEAEDLLDFTVALLERMYTEPERLRLAKERRDVRRGT